MGRAPCCDKANVKKGPWSPEEDAKLKSYIDQHGTGGNWIALPQKIGLKRCGKSCRLRWLNYLRPNIKHGGFSEEEDNLICSLYISIGSRWSIIAAQLPGRTDNDIKNYWNTRLKKKLLGKQHRKVHRKPTPTTTSAGGGSIKGRSEAAAPPADHCNDQLINGLVIPNTTSSYRPPIPYSNEESRLNEQAAIRKLLLNLGGRFSSDDIHTSHSRSHSSSASMEGTEVVLQTIQAVDPHNDHHLEYCNNSLEVGGGSSSLDAGLEFLLSSGDPQEMMMVMSSTDEDHHQVPKNNITIDVDHHTNFVSLAEGLLMTTSHHHHKEDHQYYGFDAATAAGVDQMMMMMMHPYQEGAARSM